MHQEDEIMVARLEWCLIVVLACIVITIIVVV